MIRTRRRASGGEPPALNVSALMDILTILLLFLILSFDAQEETVRPPPGIVLPDSEAQAPVKLAVRVRVLPGEVTVEGQRVALIRGGRVRSEDLDGQGLLPALMSGLRDERARLRQGRMEGASDGELEILYLEADKGIPYRVLRPVLSSARRAGFGKIRLAVHRQE